MLNWIFKFLLGDDIFVSYSRADGATYAAGLANELTKLKFSCKLDQWGTESGAEMPESLKKALKRSAVLVLVGTEGAARSRHVGSEIEEFKKIGRMVIPIVFDGILLKNGLIYRDGVKQQTDSALPETEATWAGGIEGLPISWEKSENLKTGNPSPENVSRIEKTFTFQRKDERLRKTSLAAAIFLLLLLVASAAASVVAFVQTKNAAAATNLAAEKEQLADQKTKDAEEATEKANFEADRALKNEEIANQKTEEARVKTEEADKATKRAEEEKANADKASKLAAEKTKLAAEKTKLAEAAQNEAAKQTEIAETKRKEAEEQAEKSRQLTYATNIQLAASLYDSGQMTSFTEVLTGIDEDLTGFEWFFLKHLPEGAVRFQTEGEGAGGIGIGRMLFSPDGKYLVSTGSTSPVLLWNTKNGEKANLKTDENSTGESARDFAFATDSKEEWFAALLEKKVGNKIESKKLALWKTSGWESGLFLPEKKFDLPDAEDFEFVNFSKNNKELLTVSKSQQDYFLRRWDIQTGRQTGEYKIPLDPNRKFPVVEVLRLTANERVFVRHQESLSSNSRISFLDFSNNSPMTDVAETRNYDVIYSFSPDGERVAAIEARDSDINVNEDKVSVFDAGDGKELMSLSSGENLITSAAFSYDGEQIAVGYNDKFEIWNLKRNEKVLTIPLNYVLDYFTDRRNIAFSKDGSRVVAGGFKSGYPGQRILTLWNIDSGKDVFTFNNEKPSAVSPDGKKVVTTNSKGWTLWDTLAEKPVLSTEASQGSIVSVQFSGDGKHFFTIETSAGDDDSFPSALRLWDAETGLERKLVSGSFCRGGQIYYLTGVFSTNNALVAFACSKEVRIWNVADGSEKCRVEIVNEGSIDIEGPRNERYGLYFFQNDERIAYLFDRYAFPVFGNLDTTELLHVWNVENGEEIPTETEVEKTLAFSPDGLYKITEHEDEGIRLRKTNGDNSEPVILDVGWIERFAFSKESDFLALWGRQNDEKVSKYVVKDLTKTRDLFSKTAEKNSTGIVGFSPSGRWVRFGNKYWNRETGKEVKIVGCTENPAFSADEDRLITSCSDGTIKFWSLKSGQEVFTLKAHDSTVKQAILMKDYRDETKRERYLLTTSDTTVKLWRTTF